MSRRTGDPLRAQLTGGRRAFRSLARPMVADRIGLTVGLGILLVVATTWRVGFLINDNYALANALMALDRGQLHIADIRYGPAHGMTPGVRYGDGLRYGRHYGMLVLALPFVWLVEGLGAVADLRIAFAAGWSLLFLSLALQFGQLVDRRRPFAYGGCLVAIGAFAGNISVATPLDPRWEYLLALQLQTMVAAALVGVVLYRLVAHRHGPRVGAAAGVGAVLATPVGFWAPIPKRHVLVGLLALLAIYSFYRARVAPGKRLRYRVATYVIIGLTAWVSPAEGLVLFAVIAPLDLLTGRPNTPRELAVVGLAFGLSLIPMLVTNALVTGHPMTPPRMLPAYHGQPLLTESALDVAGTAGAGGGGAHPSDGPIGGGHVAADERGSGPAAIAGTIVEFAVLTLAAVPDRLADLWGYASRGVSTTLADPGRFVHTFVYSGYLPGIAERDGGEAVTLSLLESTPLASPLFLAPLLWGWADRRNAVNRWLGTPSGQTDLVAIAFCLALTGLYLHRLPVHATITVRYLVPAMPLAVYLLARMPPIHRAIGTHPSAAAAAYVATVLIGGQLLLAALVLIDPGRGEAVQVHARLGLLAAGLVGGWTAVAVTGRRDRARAGAVLLGGAAGLTTVFLLLSSWEYFAYSGPHTLSLVERLAAAIEIL